MRIIAQRSERGGNALADAREQSGGRKACFFRTTSYRDARIGGRSPR
jgi:hypothetical protein